MYKTGETNIGLYTVIDSITKQVENIDSLIEIELLA